MSEKFGKMPEFSGNFAHLHVVFETLSNAKKFLKINNKLIGSFINNSDFDHKVNFSDIYVKEFFLLFNKYLSTTLSRKSIIKIENIMLKKYLPKLILKSRFGYIKKDDLVGQNFDLIFGNNDYYKNNRSFFTVNNIFSSIILCLILTFNLLKK